jgi:hypothetical protein
LQGGVQGADITYTLPTAVAGGDGYSLTSTTGGVLSWTNVSAGVADIGTSIPSGTPGSVLYVDGSNQSAQDNANFFWDATNHRLGIGTTSPDNQLQVNSGATPATGQVKLTAVDTGSLAFLTYSADDSAISFDADWEGSAWVARDTTVAAIYKRGDQLVVYGSGGNTPGSPASGIAATQLGLMNFDLANNVIGIGTATPVSTTKLTVDVNVSSGGYYAIGAYNSSVPDNAEVYFGLGKGQTSLQSGILGYHVGTAGASYSDSYLVMQNYGDTLGKGVSVLAGGYVGINSIAPKANLWVHVGTDLNLGVGVDGTSVLLYADQDDNGALKPLRIAGSTIVLNSGGGNVGIGNTSPTTALDVTGSITSSTIASSCDVFSDGSGTLICDPSSRRYKDNIQNLSFDKEKFLSLQTITFEYKKNLVNVEGEQVGFIAEDVLPIFPDLVRYKDGQIEGIKYEKIPIYLYQIVQDQQKDIDAIKTLLGISTANGESNVDGIMGGMVQNLIGSLGIAFEDGLTTIKNLAVTTFTAKTATVDHANINKLEMNDATTGEKYCVWIDHGQIQTQQGACDSISQQNNTDSSSLETVNTPPQSQENNPSSDPVPSDLNTSSSDNSTPDASSTDTPPESVTP